MYKRYRYIGFLFLWLCAGTAAAQDAENVSIDTIVAITEIKATEYADTTRFERIQQQGPVLSRRVSQHTFDSLLADGDYWYANLAPVKKKMEQPRSGKDSLFRQQWFRNLLWIVILSSFIGVVIWYLVSSRILIFRKKARNIAAEEDENVAIDDIFSIRYEQEIAKAADARNYRLAVRLWYLYLLKELSEKGHIEYRYGRTNHDYLLQLQKGPYYRDFSRLTRNFEYTWYGQFDLSAAAYEMMRNDFSTFKHGLRR